MRRKVCITCKLFLVPLFLLAQKDTVPGVNKLLEFSLEDLMHIKVVNAAGYLQTTSEHPSTVALITAQQMADRGYEHLEDALRDIPGIDMIHINGYAPTLIYFRGMYGAENLRALLMIDGIAENNIPGSNDMAGPVYSLHNVTRIEIIWGPVSALYGANAFGGVINIISKKGAAITNKLERLVKDLLEVSNLKSGQLKLNREPFDIDQLPDDTIGAFQMIAKTHTIVRENNFNHATIIADKRRIEQVLLNLLSNAVKYSPGKNSIIVWAIQKSKALVINIRHFGIGFPQDEQESIFNRFYRIKDVSKHIVGFGPGLFICRDIIQRHHGKIWMEKEARGSAFYFSLPYYQLPDLHTVS